MTTSRYWSKDQVRMRVNTPVSQKLNRKNTLTGISRPTSSQPTLA